MRIATIAAIIALSAAGFGLTSCSSEAIAFQDVRAQTEQFMRWEREIRLTPEQEAVKRAALEAIPAPCCGENSAYTCCCPCNLSRTTWGLSNWLIAEKGYSAAQVREKAAEWIAFVNPGGYSGAACHTGGCSRPFHEDGCGGMNPDRVNF